MKKICLIEDDLGIAGSLKLYLENSDFNCSLYHTGEWACEFIQSENPDLVIMDINLPVKDGIQICKELREISQIPVIMLTARGSESDRISGFDSGADDYVAKPFSPRELLARVQSILRRSWASSKENSNKTQLWDIEILHDSNEVFVHGEEVGLTKNEFDIFEKIIRAKWKIVTREWIMKEVIGYENYVYDRTIDTHIKNIRRKIKNKDLIVTVRGKWYRINV